MTDLDRLIDDVAREMTDAPAAPSLRQRVVDEAKASFHPSASYHLGKWAWLAAAAAVVIAAYLQFSSPGEPERRTSPSSTQASREEPRAIPDTSVRAERPAVAAVRSTAAPGQARPLAERGAAATIPELPALTGPNALAIRPLDSGAHGVAALDGAAPLDVERLDIKPLALPH
jgi:hypothetical protein